MYHAMACLTVPKLSQFDQTRKIPHNSEKSVKFWSIMIGDVFSVSINTHFPVHNQDFQNP